MHLVSYINDKKIGGVAGEQTVKYNRHITLVGLFGNSKCRNALEFARPFVSDGPWITLFMSDHERT